MKSALFRSGAALSGRAGFFLPLWLALGPALGLAGWLALGPTLVLATTPPLATAEVRPVAQTDGQADLPDGLRLIFPAAPAGLEGVEAARPAFASGTPGYDLLPLGVLPATGPAQTEFSKTLTLELNGGLQGRVFDAPGWLQARPERFVNPSGPGRLPVSLRLRDSGGGPPGLLPGQTNWGRLLVSLNGALFEYAAPLVVGSPASAGYEPGRALDLGRAVADRLEAQGELSSFIASPAFPNAAQTALGLATGYLASGGYGGRLPEGEWAGRVAELLAGRDFDNDGRAGFRPEEVAAGAPAWALGRQISRS